MYLTQEDGVALLRRIVDHFPSGELQFDAFNRLGIKSQWTNTVVRRSGATLHWGIDGPDDIIEAVPGVRLLAWVSAIDVGRFRRGAVVLPGDAEGDEARCPCCATWRSTTATPSEPARRAPVAVAGRDPNSLPTASGRGRRPRPTAAPECPGRRAPRQNSCAHRDGPPRRSRGVVRRRQRCAAPGLRMRPPTAAPATLFSTRAARCGDRPVTNSSGRPRSCSPIVYAYGRRSSSTPCTAHPCTRIVCAKFVEVFLGGAVGVVALPAHDRTFL